MVRSGILRSSPVGDNTDSDSVSCQACLSSNESTISDGRDLSGYNKKAWKKQQKAIKRYADTNKITHLNQHFIPRTERAPKDRNLAEKEPEKFAAMLMEKLVWVKEERDKLERVKENLELLETDEEKDAVMMPPPSTCPVKPAAAPPANPFNVLLAMADNDREDNAQSILEEHVSRIWDNSNGQTPIRSPGRHSPKSFSHDQSIKYPFAPGPSPNVSGNNLLPTVPKSHTHTRRKDKEGTNAFLSNSSYDSGLPEDKSGVFYETEPQHKYVYHHHHHHHHVVKDTANTKSRPAESPDQFNRSLHCHINAPTLPLPNFTDSFVAHRPHNTHSHLWEDPNRTARSSKDLKRSGGKKGAVDSSSNIDSGVGIPSETANVAMPNTPANEKVMAWMLENEKMTTSTNPQYSTDGSDKGSSQKRSHKSSTTSQHKPTAGTSKKSSTSFNTSRSGSLDRSGYNSFHQPVGGDYSFNASLIGASSDVLPNQPIIQDPSMPPLNPPNTRTQIEEAKRRLEVESSRATMKQSKSFTGGSSSSSSSRDRRAMAPPSTYPVLPPRGASQSQSIKTVSVIPQVAPLDLSSSEDHSSHGSHKSDKRSQKKVMSMTASAPVTPVQPSGQTIIGYFFCSEPIPYRTTLPGKNITLAQFKQLISKKGNYRYFFKTISDEFDSGVVHEEVTEDDQVLPFWDNKIIGKVEKRE